MSIFVEFLCHYRQALSATQLNIAPLCVIYLEAQQLNIAPHCVIYLETQLFLVKFIYAAPLMPPFKESQVS